MRVRCYVEGNASRSREYDLPPNEAAEAFAKEVVGPRRSSVDIEVIPLDDEAKALRGWISNELPPAFKIFSVMPTTEWVASEVKR